MPFASRSLKFGNDNAFHREIRRRVDDYFQTTGRRRRDSWQMYAKTAVIVAGFAASYVLLVFVAQTWWHGLLFAVLLGLSAAERRSAPVSHRTLDGCAAWGGRMRADDVSRRTTERAPC